MGCLYPSIRAALSKELGAGDFSDLIKLIEWTGDIGGQVVATLPLLPTYVDHIFEPSPYLPVSRLLWNEFFLDITRVAGLFYGAIFPGVSTITRRYWSIAQFGIGRLPAADGIEA